MTDKPFYTSTEAADVVMFIYRDDYYNPDTSDYKNAAELNIAKHRNGETGMAMLHVKKSIMKFGNRISEEINL